MQKKSKKRLQKVAVYWHDIRVYDDGEECEPSLALTEGYLHTEHVEFVVVIKPITILFNPLRNHPDDLPHHYYIPRAMIKEIIYEEK